MNNIGMTEKMDNRKQCSRIMITAIKSGSGKTVFTCGLLYLLKNYNLFTESGDADAESEAPLHTTAETAYIETAEAASKEKPEAAAHSKTSENKTGFKVIAHKCGPDYIDPMFHRTVLGIEGTNLDPFFSDGEELNSILAEDEADITVIEGAMGIYDGISGMGKKGSCYEVAQKTKTPIILLVDAAGSGATIVSVIKGILADDEDCLIKGMIFNRMSGMYLKTLKPELEESFRRINRDIKLLGAIPKQKNLNVESRHLGLVMPNEIDDVLEQISSFAGLINENIDIDGLLELACNAEAVPENGAGQNCISQCMSDIQCDDKVAGTNTPGQNCISQCMSDMQHDDKAAGNITLKQSMHGPESKIETDVGLSMEKKPVLAVARDEAFCFYYKQNLKLLERYGAQIRYFSPLRDKKLPEGAAGLLLGGGYPELFLKELSDNKEMRREIQRAITAGMPSLAECGGFMYLGEYIEDEEGTRWPMAGLISEGFRNQRKLTRFGYVTVTHELSGEKNKDACSEDLRSYRTDDKVQIRDSLLTAPVRGHEFHYYDCENPGTDCIAQKPGSTRKWKCIYMGKNHLWGFPHLYYPSCPELVTLFIREMKSFVSYNQKL